MCWDNTVTTRWGQLAAMEREAAGGGERTAEGQSAGVEAARQEEPAAEVEEAVAKVKEPGPEEAAAEAEEAVLEEAASAAAAETGAEREAGAKGWRATRRPRQLRAASSVCSPVR